TVPGDTASAGPASAGPGSTGPAPTGPGGAGPGSSSPGRPGQGRWAGAAGAGGRRPGGRSPRPGGAPWRAAFLVVLALVIVAGAAWALLGSSLLVVRHVQVSGNRGVPAAEVSTASGIEPGTPLARLTSAAAQRRIERIPQVLSALVSRSWPDTVVIAVRERTAQLAVAAGAGFKLVDGHGVVVAATAT